MVGCCATGEDHALSIKRHFPAGCDLVGWWLPNTQPTAASALSVGGCAPSLLLFGGDTLQGFLCYYDDSNSKKELVKVTLSEREVGLLLEVELMTLRVRTVVKISLPCDSNGECWLRVVRRGDEVLTYRQGPLQDYVSPARTDQEG